MNTNDHQDANDAGPVSFDEARQIASRFINGHFKNPGKEGPRTRIPADPKRDDDIRLIAFIEQQRRASAAPKEGEVERLRGALEQIAKEEESGYGYYHGGDPRKFCPGEEDSTPEEREAHKRACEAWDKAEKEGLPMPDAPSPSGWITRDIHVTRSSFGLGGYTYPTRAAHIAMKALERPLRLSPAGEGGGS